MTLIVHRAPRADLLADGLADLLRDPLEDPFAQELVLVPARGVERWLSQRLSHRLGPADGHEDGVCAGVEFRSPASLVAELVIGDGGTREDDPWSPDALVWPLLSVVDDHAGEEWCRVLSQHLGHGEPGEEGDLRRGRRYAVARRLARLFASYAVQRPTLLAEWESGRDTDGAGGALDPDLTWQPELWRLLVAQVDAPSPHQRHRDVLEALDARPDEVDLPSRFSLFGHTRIPVTEVELLAALGGTATSTSGCRTPPLRCGTRSPTSPEQCRAARTARTSGSATRCSRRWAATCASSSGTSRRSRTARRPSEQVDPARHPARLAAARHRGQRDGRARLPLDPARGRLGPGARLSRAGAPGRGPA